MNRLQTYTAQASERVGEGFCKNTFELQRTRNEVCPRGWKSGRFFL
jgi:hypothetical protein